MLSKRLVVLLLLLAPVRAARGEELPEQVLGALYKLDSLALRIRYTGPATQAGVTPPELVAEAVMARGGHFRVRVLGAGEEIAGLCADGTTIFEWDARAKRWTRYPAGDGELMLRLIPEQAEGAQLGVLLRHLAGSWLDPGGPYEWRLQRLRLADEVNVAMATVAGRPCHVV